MKPVIFGLSGLELTADEVSFLTAHQPLGVILFRRNIGAPDQVRALTTRIRDLLDTDAPCLWVDQEGGRVQRLTAPYWEKLPAAGEIAAIHDRDPEASEYAAFLLGRVIADQARQAGFDIVCAPVLDLSIEGAHRIVGDRAFGAAPEQAATLARAMAEGLIQGGVVPVSKHWPGHGRAMVDSHLDLPSVDLDMASLQATDFDAFRHAADCAPIAMTGHLMFPQIDPEKPATLSPTIIQKVMRDYCGFGGVIVSDDLDMKALQGARGALAQQALAAGCDAVLQCSGDMSVMKEVAQALNPMSDAAVIAWRTALGTPVTTDPIDRAQLITELTDTLL